MNNPLVSIIVPCYKVEKFLPTCIESILKQSYSNWELILVEDGSPDRCGEIADEYALKDERIKVLHKQNGGLSSARNAGIRIMKGEYVTFVDSDDFLHAEALRTFISLADKYKAQIVQCNFVRGNEIIFPHWNGHEMIEVYDNHTIFTKFAAKIIVWGKLYKREILEGITMPEGIVNEDDWTTWKYYYRAKKIIVTNRPLYYYTVNLCSTMSTLKKTPDTTYYGAYDERILFFQENHEKELEETSRIQFCKSLVMLYSNECLTIEQRHDIKRRIGENWQILKSAKTLPLWLKFLFGSFVKCPMVVSKLVKLKTIR